MYQAENENKIRIEAEEATKGLKYFCPCCGKEVILKQGDVVTWHFAHKSSKECDSWYSMSKWHEEWQKSVESFQKLLACNDYFHTHSHIAATGEIPGQHYGSCLEYNRS